MYAITIEVARCFIWFLSVEGWVQQNDRELSFLDEAPYFISIVGGLLCLYLAMQELIPNHKLAQVCSTMFIYSNLFAFIRGKTWPFHLGHLLFWSLVLVSFADFFPFMKGGEQAVLTVLFFIATYVGGKFVLRYFQTK